MITDSRNVVSATQHNMSINRRVAARRGARPVSWTWRQILRELAAIARLLSFLTSENLASVSPVIITRNHHLDSTLEHVHNALTRQSSLILLHTKHNAPSAPTTCTPTLLVPSATVQIHLYMILHCRSAFVQLVFDTFKAMADCQDDVSYAVTRRI